MVIVVDFLRKSILTTFQEKQENCCLFLNENCFNINYLYKVSPKTDEMKVIMMFLSHFLFIERNYVIFDLRNFLFDADQNATCFLLTHLNPSHPIQPSSHDATQQWAGLS